MQKHSPAHVGQGDEGHDDEGPHQVSHGPGFEYQFAWVRRLGNHLSLLPARHRRKRAHVDGEDSEVPEFLVSGAASDAEKGRRAMPLENSTGIHPRRSQHDRRGRTRDMEGGFVKEQEGR
jgi:hypothetical protein